MSSALSTIPPSRRRRSAATIGLFGTLFVAVGVVAFSGAQTTLVRVFAVVALVAAALLALIAWGLLHSVRLDAAAAERARLGGGHGAGCACGHDHEPAPQAAGSVFGCDHDGTGSGCEHDCNSCALAALRPSPTTPRAERLSS